MRPAAGSGGVTLCRHPYPYKAMLAICSDLDETPSADVYFDTSAYLNSSTSTAFGNGLGLEAGNTLYFHMPDGELSYFAASSAEQSRMRSLIRSGHIDCFHSFGDTATSRDQAGEILDHLASHDCHIKVWVDHAAAPSNFGRDIMRGFGDVPGSPVYHADLTLGYGVEYVWLGRVTSLQGQDTRPRYLQIFDSGLPGPSSRTLSREVAKAALGMAGNRKYRMHFGNRLVRETSLRDGQDSIEFMRSNANPGGVSVGDTAAGLADALSPKVLDNLVAGRAKSIVYTHLGKEIDPRHGFPERTRRALEQLSDRFAGGEILVTTTRRLLDYSRMVESLHWSSREEDQVIHVAIDHAAELPLDGLSFRAPAGKRVVLEWRGQEVGEVVKRDETGGSQVVMVPWRRLSYE